MKHPLKALLSLAAIALAAQAPAAITTSVIGNSTTGAAGITSWPNPHTDRTTPANPGVDFTVGENNWGGASLFSLGTSWTATQSGSLSDLQIMISGTAPVSFNVSLYDGGLSGWADQGGTAYNPGVNVSLNLFTDTSAQTWTGFTLGGATAAVLDFSLSGADQVAILAGHQYILELSSAVNPSNLIWYRNGATGNYTAGQAFRQRGPLNGNPARDMALAVQYLGIPEPSSMALFGFGSLASLFALRRRKS